MKAMDDENPREDSQVRAGGKYENTRIEDQIDENETSARVGELKPEVENKVTPIKRSEIVEKPEKERLGAAAPWKQGEVKSIK